MFGIDYSTNSNYQEILKLDRMLTDNRTFKEYVVTFPDPDVDKSNANKNKTYGITKSHIVKKESVASPEPLNICVSTEEMKDSCKMLSGVLEMVKQIKDRPVFITIS